MTQQPWGGTEPGWSTPLHSDWTVRAMNCPLCARTDLHRHDLGVVQNARYYCPDGELHEMREERRWFRRRLRCARCDYTRRP